MDCYSASQDLLTQVGPLSAIANCILYHLSYKSSQYNIYYGKELWKNCIPKLYPYKHLWNTQDKNSSLSSYIAIYLCNSVKNCSMLFFMAVYQNGGGSTQLISSIASLLLIDWYAKPSQLRKKQNLPYSVFKHSLNTWTKCHRLKLAIFFSGSSSIHSGLPGGSAVKKSCQSPEAREMWSLIPGLEDPMEEAIAKPSSICPCKFLQTKESARGYSHLGCKELNRTEVTEHEHWSSNPVLRVSVVGLC